MLPYAAQLLAALLLVVGQPLAVGQLLAYLLLPLAGERPAALPLLLRRAFAASQLSSVGLLVGQLCLGCPVAEREFVV